MPKKNLFPSKNSPLRIGTRSSPLAMAQAKMVAHAIIAAHHLDNDAILLTPMLSQGDIVTDRPIADIGGKAVWSKELERALLHDEIDVAVHSMKDVETPRPSGLAITACLPRDDVRDCIIGVNRIDDLPQGATIGTSSPRRAAQIKHIRPDLITVPIRGNVATRLDKLAKGEAEATFLAAAGLDRLGLNKQNIGVNFGHIDVDVMLPAASQGAIGIESLADNAMVNDLLYAINHPPTYECVMAERALIRALNGNCHSPIAAFAQQKNGEMLLQAELFSEDGTEHIASAIIIAEHEMDMVQEKADILAQRLFDMASPMLRAQYGQ
ncbi:hydroxymethylbilane synthase [Sphingorhabdus lutea]|uniref:Porphobilinogen deaminase n=2 Tax=Sphingorhabdus lutea TaxID=1913578 RepID=A0A1L3JE83_9SPHN|nr:hydroxymethylbilane synthase [Sphingorhabdus lutea]